MDKVTARELELYINNDGDLHRQQYAPILKNLMTKHAQGRYDSEAAVKLFMYLVDNGAKKYAKDHGGPGANWNELFPKSERTHVAKMLRDDFEDEAKLGNYDDLIPKKYKGKVSGKTIREGVETEGGPLFDGATRQALSEAASRAESSTKHITEPLKFIESEIKRAQTTRFSDTTEFYSIFSNIQKAAQKALRSL